jgi:hypothetical protein
VTTMGHRTDVDDREILGHDTVFTTMNTGMAKSITAHASA